MKTAIITLVIGDIGYSEYSIPSMKKYAEKIGADFIVIDKKTINMKPHFEKYQIANYLDEYDKVCYMDADIMISPDTPNIFDNTDGIYGVTCMFEPVITKVKEVMEKICSKYGKIEWTDYINTGVIVAEKRHKKIFEELKTFNYSDLWFEQTPLNYIIQKYDTIKRLDPKFNFFNPYKTKDPYIFHYAGVGRQGRCRLMKEKELQWLSMEKGYKKKN